VSTPQEFQRVSAELTQLRAQVAALAAEWVQAEDEADAYGPRSAFDGRDCAEHLRDLLERS
jgi:hypothetical protein